MIFQPMILPSFCECQQLYINGSAKIDDGKVLIPKDKGARTDTYFNSLSIKKLLKYTRISQVRLSIHLIGKCRVTLESSWIDNTNKVRFKVLDTKITEGGESTVNFDCELNPEYSVLFWRIQTFEDVTVTDWEWSSDISCNDVNLALCICTYKREEFVQRNVSRLIESGLFEKYPRTHVFICDNARSLPDIDNPNVTVLKNINAGGAGGFTRCMIEVGSKSEEFTHFVLMDDDINLDPATIYRNISLLKVLKEEFLECIIGGGMFTLDKPWQQFENGGLYEHGMMYFPNKNRDMRQICSIMENEYCTKLNYAAWCYCCMPVSIIEKQGLPLPIFIHMDDIEYGTRWKHEVITFNGITVWHPFYPNQRTSSIVYFDMRNKMIVLSRDLKVDVVKYAVKMLDSFLPYVFKFNYNRFLAACSGFEDFCKGPEEFAKHSAEEIFEKESKFRDKWEPIPEGGFEISKPPKKRPISYSLALSHYRHMFSKRTVYLDDDISQVPHGDYERLYLVNPHTGKYTVYESSFWMDVRCFIRYKRVKKKIRKTMLQASKEWNRRIPEFEKSDFWREYLGL